MTVKQQTVVIPSNPTDRQTILDAIKEASLSLAKIEAEKEQIKAINDEIKEKFDIPPKLMNKLIKLYHKDAFVDFEQEVDDVKEAYDAIIG